jgi:hypothetical protein
MTIAPVEEMVLGGGVLSALADGAADEHPQVTAQLAFLLCSPPADARRNARELP